MQYNWYFKNLFINEQFCISYHNLTFYQMAKIQTGPISKHLQSTIWMWLKKQNLFETSRKHGGKRRKCWLPAFSSFAPCFQKAISSRSFKFRLKGQKGIYSDKMKSFLFLIVTFVLQSNWLNKKDLIIQVFRNIVLLSIIFIYLSFLEWNTCIAEFFSPIDIRH